MRLSQSSALSKRVGIKVSPGMAFNDLSDADPIATHVALAKAIDPMQLAYLHIMRAGIGAEQALRAAFTGTILLGGGFQKTEANAALEAKQADAIVFGTSYLANPDLPKRLGADAALNAPDQSTFYTPGPKGYLDYPTL